MCSVPVSMREELNIQVPRVDGINECATERQPGVYSVRFKQEHTSVPVSMREELRFTEAKRAGEKYTDYIRTV